MLTARVHVVAGGAAAADAFTLIGVAAGLVAGTWLAMVFRGPIHDLLAKTVDVRR